MAREHGSYACYVAKCPDCPREDQRASKNAYGRRVHRLKAYGRWQPYLDAEPVRQHVNELRAAGMGGERIAELAGVPYKLVSALIWGVEGLPPSGLIRPWNAEKILAVQASLDLLAPCALIDATGSRRRLQALQANGWAQRALAKRIGMGRSQTHLIVGAKTTFVRAETARTIRDLYEQMWDQVPPEETPTEKRTASIARRVAREHGWAKPMQWDDDTIDDPEAEPESQDPSGKRHRRLPPAEDIDWLVQGGDSIEVIADRFGTKPDAVRQSLHRYRKRVAA